MQGPFPDARAVHAGKGGRGEELGLTGIAGVGSVGFSFVKARSSGGERYPDTVEVLGSNPSVPTMIAVNGAGPPDRPFFQESPGLSRLQGIPCCLPLCR